MVYRWLVRPLLFRLDPERAHHLTLWMLKQVGRLPPLHALLRRSLLMEHPLLRTRVWGLDFSNPVGLAAGFDKGGTAVGGLAGLGFGFIEVGTVTPRPQPGNPLPRLFRLPAEQAVINRMGFNSEGAEAVGKRLRAGGLRIPVGVNLGKNADTRLEHALDDCCQGLEHLYDLGDYFVINVSSPNTPGLRDLQECTRLNDLLIGMQQSNRGLARMRGTLPKPLFVKIAPDLEPKELDGVIEVVQTVPLDGIIATNTTVGRAGLSAPTPEVGGLSGMPLRRRATEVVHYLFTHAEGRIPIIGVGGIFSAEDAYEKICAGASLVQVYTGLVYEGPTLPHRINLGLIRLLQRDGFTHVSQAVGCAGRLVT